MWTLEILRKLRLSHDARRVECGDELWLLPSSEDALEWLGLCQAGWVYKGNPTKPHVELASLKHSTGFFLCRKLLKYGNLREIIAACIIARLREAGIGEVDGVFGAPSSSTTLAADVGRLLRVPNYELEKGPKDAAGKTTMVFKADDPVPADSVLLSIEELMTTTESNSAARRAIVDANPYPVQFAPFIGVFVYRPPVIRRQAPNGDIIVPFVEKQIDAWDPQDCPECKKGSVAIKAKGDNWVKLLA